MCRVVVMAHRADAVSNLQGAKEARTPSNHPPPLLRSAGSWATRWASAPRAKPTAGCGRCPCTSCRTATRCTASPVSGGMLAPGRRCHHKEVLLPLLYSCLSCLPTLLSPHPPPHQYHCHHPTTHPPTNPCRLWRH